MALEIKELEIRMRVADAKPAREAAPEPGGCDARSQAEIVEDSVRRVLQTLKNMQER